MLTLPIKKKWFDMILSGEKKEEYREIKAYYTSRFSKIFGENVYLMACINCPELPDIKCSAENIMFRNGYSKVSPSFIAKCTLSAGTGREEWGAENGKEYYILTIHEILKEREDKTDGKQ